MVSETYVNRISSSIGMVAASRTCILGVNTWSMFCTRDVLERFNIQRKYRVSPWIKVMYIIYLHTLQNTDRIYSIHIAYQILNKRWHRRTCAVPASTANTDNTANTVRAKLGFAVNTSFKNHNSQVVFQEI